MISAFDHERHFEIRKAMIPFVKFEGAPPPKNDRSGRPRRKYLQAHAAIASLKVGEAVAMPISPDFATPKKAQNTYSVLGRRYFGKGNITTRITEDKQRVVLYRIAPIAMAKEGLVQSKDERIAELEREVHRLRCQISGPPILSSAGTPN